MRGNKQKSIVAENLHAALPAVFEKQRFGAKAKLCWKCQKSKSPVGGHIKTYPGLLKFICKDCLDAKQALKDTDA